MNAAALALVLALGCVPPTAGLRLGKFQLLTPARISGTVVAVHGTEFDLDAPSVAAPWPWAGGVVHCEAYGHSGLREEPGVVLTVGQRVAVSGWLVLDDAVHRGEEPGRVVMRGPFRAERPKIELHPYWSGTIEHDPASLVTSPVRVEYFAEVYSGRWAWNDVAGIDGAPVPGSFTEAVLPVGAP